MTFQLLSETPFHKHCDTCFHRLQRYAIWSENESWEVVEYCSFCLDTDMWELYGDITDDRDGYSDDKIELGEEMDTNLRW